MLPGFGYRHKEDLGADQDRLDLEASMSGICTSSYATNDKIDSDEK